ncbi:hypothetical protein [Paenibacillus sp. 1P07SE]|uniref:hypothetical protein n=1 Tax=Paenibacillus sp. 1P07SE TaxID=3132209 RepID=UPI0039A6689C
MKKRDARSVERLVANSQRLERILTEVDEIQARVMKRRAGTRMSQQQLMGISDSLDQTLRRQEQTLEELKRIAAVQ